MYIGLLAVPEPCYQAALSGLQEDRNKAKYDGEVHFAELRNRSYATVHNKKTLLARYWIERFLSDSDKMFHFYLLGLDRDKLHPGAFGRGAQQERNFYNRFFRASLTYLLKSFFSSRHVVVSRVFHDRDSLEHDDLFDWHAMWRIGSDNPGIRFLESGIKFIDSDHRKEVQHSEDSHFIQLCDIVMGGLRQCLDATSNNAGICEIAELVLPLARRLVDPTQARNPNSRFGHKNRIAVGFFPSKKLRAQDMQDAAARARSGFFIQRRLLLEERCHGQIRLPDFE